MISNICILTSMICCVAIGWILNDMLTVRRVKRHVRVVSDPDEIKKIIDEISKDK